MGPLLSFLISFGIWSIFFFSRIKLKFIILLIFIGVNSYSFIITGWARFSKFRFIGGVRASSQTVSYEVRLNITLILSLFLLKNLNLNFIKENTFFIYSIILVLWLIIILSETNRAPFDFSEGERELISGFNTEYGSLGFVYFILSEYSIIIFFSFIISSLLNFNGFFFFLVFFLIIRARFPRFRYDYLINLIWFKILPFSCLMLLALIRFCKIFKELQILFFFTFLNLRKKKKLI